MLTCRRWKGTTSTGRRDDPSRTLQRLGNPCPPPVFPEGSRNQRFTWTQKVISGLPIVHSEFLLGTRRTVVVSRCRTRDFCRLSLREPRLRLWGSVLPRPDGRRESTTPPKRAGPRTVEVLKNRHPRSTVGNGGDTETTET